MPVNDGENALDNLKGCSNETKENKTTIRDPFWTFSPANKPLFSTPEEMQEKILEYFRSGHRVKKYYCKTTGEFKEVPVFTITGLCLFLGFESRQSFYAYEAKEIYCYTIKRARTFMEMEYEEQLSHGNPTAAIFALKNFGWKDTQTVEGELNNNGTNTMKVEYVEADHSNYNKDGNPIETEKEEKST